MPLAVDEEFLEEDDLRRASMPCIRDREALLQTGRKQIDILLTELEEEAESWLLVCNFLNAATKKLAELTRLIRSALDAHDLDQQHPCRVALCKELNVLRVTFE